MKTILAVPLSLLTLLSCGKRRVRGAGEDVSATRDVALFTALETAGSERVDVYPAPAPRVEISGYENLVPLFESTVSNGVLCLHFKDDIGNISNTNILVKVYGPGIRKVSGAGSGNIVVHPGAGVLVEEAEIAGSGDITINQADAPALSLSIAGSGNIKARGARAATVSTEVAGSGNIEVTATELLKASIAGSGDVHYWGTARVEKDVVGSGDVVQH